MGYLLGYLLILAVLMARRIGAVPVRPGPRLPLAEDALPPPGMRVRFDGEGQWYWED